jgi:hypothetical protein
VHFRFCIAGGSRPAGLRWLPASQCCLPSSTCAAVDDALSGSRGGKVSASGLLNVVACCSVHAVQARGRPGGSAGLPTGAAGGRPGLCPPAPQLTTRWVAIEKWRRCWRHCHTHTATYSGDLFNVRRAGHEPASPPAAARSWPLVPQLVRSRSLAPVFKTVATLPRRTLPLQEHPLLRPPSCRYPAGIIMHLLLRTSGAPADERGELWEHAAAVLASTQRGQPVGPAVPATAMCG